MQKSSLGVNFKENTMFVSQTDTLGKIVYANVEFCKISGYSFGELVGNSHNIVRHKDTPKVIFKLLWQRLQNNKPVYTFVKNKTKDGGYYWVKAFISPIIKNGIVERYVSYRTLIEDEKSIQNVINLYTMLCDYEKYHSINESYEYFLDYLKVRNMNYDTFLMRLTQGKQVTNIESLSIDIQSYFDDHVIFRTHIIRKVDLGMEDIEVTKPCCCRFGKWLEKVKNSNYAKHQDWQKILSAHNDVHHKLQKYVDKSKDGASKIELKKLENSISDNTHTIFETLENVIDKYED